MSAIIQAILVGGKKDYACAYSTLIRRLRESFGIDVEWDPRGKKPIDPSRYDLVLITPDIASHNTTKAAVLAAKKSGVKVIHIERKWGRAYTHLKAAGLSELSLEKTAANSPFSIMEVA